MTTTSTGFYAAAAGDHPRFRAVVADLNGLHQVRFPTVLEAAVWFVLSQRTPQPVSMRTKRRIAETYGGRVMVAGQAYQAFPELAELVGLSQAQWRSLVGE